MGTSLLLTQSWATTAPLPASPGLRPCSPVGCAQVSLLNSPLPGTAPNLREVEVGASSGRQHSPSAHTCWHFMCICAHLPSSGSGGHTLPPLCGVRGPARALMAGLGVSGPQHPQTRSAGTPEYHCQNAGRSPVPPTSTSRSSLSK